jgi:glycosyltransferase involved in cell wall biosynthesis
LLSWVPELRIAIISQQGGKASGAEHTLLQFVSRLPPGVETDWIFLEDGEFANWIRQRYASVKIVQMSDRVANVQRGGLRLSALVDGVRVAGRLTRELTRLRPDVVLTNSMKAHIVGSLAARLAGLRCINYIHDMVEGRALTLLRLMSRWCAVERLTCSKLVKTNVCLPRTTVVYAAIDVDAFAELPDRAEARRALGLPEGDITVVGLVGRIARWKGQDKFLRIAADILDWQNAHFCIIGSPLFGCDEDYVEQLHADAKHLGLGSRLTFVPWQENMQNVYAALDVACNCSEREPFGRTSLEALASGVPIVCFDDAGVCEIFAQGNGGMQVPAGNEAAFASTVGAYLAQPRQLAAARVRARATARAMDVSRAYAVFANAIERVTGQRLQPDCRSTETMHNPSTLLPTTNERRAARV